VLFGPPIFLTWLLLAAFTYFFSDLKNNPYHGWIKTGFGLLILLTVSLLSTFHEMGFFSIITLSKQHEQETFWDRNKDTIAIAIISALLGASLTWLVTYLTAN
jgi:hypothetical protein